MSIVTAGEGIVFMRVGTHAGEALDDIVDRKLKEIRDVGHAFWGYGGSSCHPRSIVQPYAEDAARAGGGVRLCMEEVPAERETYWADDDPAREWSIDGINFRPMPAGIRVTGSRYAFVVTGLRRERLPLPLSQVRVAAGPNRGRIGADYVDDVGGRVDKAVLQVARAPERSEDADGPGRVVMIDLVADLHRPYAVFLR
ncbi:hypothetical protein SR41_16635 [Sphingomonas melonis]|uniref:Uncharacterized protein n=1 Tax=Sphingomonas melonis TaxID=152682 RepID=A0A0D1M208_9SPHN|nr:hypothetical protein SR41_16635 [Sphingomonas melonis]